MYLLLCASVFILAYCLNILMITIGYHRGLAHKAVGLGSSLRSLVIRGGIWVTGLDPKAWVVMHRMHHAHSDTPLDPHSPTNVGITGIALEQLRHYKLTIRGLASENPAYTMHAKDLDFPLSRINFRKRWILPYAAHAVIGLALAWSVGWWLGIAYFLGMMSHPVQGGLVNAFGHAVGPRNFDTPDNSRNNLWVGLLVFGEGYQNNHHRYPNSASFSYRAYEVDLGYWFCAMLARVGLLRIEWQQLIPRPHSTPSGSEIVAR